MKPRDGSGAHPVPTSHPAFREIALDATLDFGGHTQAILSRQLPGGRLFATDVDSIELPRTEARES